MESDEIRKKFLKFFEARGHKIVPSSSLIPDDPSVLLTTAGMQQFKKYYTGEADPMKDFGSKNTVSIQKSFRTSDIDEVGDDSHNTFFEMLGNFSFGGYFKKGAIEYAYEFIIQELGLTIDYVTVFGGDSEVPRDTESEIIWKSLGVKNVKYLGREDNFWGPTGSEGPCGPTTEIYVMGVAAEIWNLVFNEYYSKDGRLDALKIKGVDTGMGLERLAAAVQNKKNIFETDLFAPLLELLPNSVAVRDKRIIVDHLRGSIFLLSDGVRPSNKDRGYMLRRLIRRAVNNERKYNIPAHVFEAIIHDVVHEYGEFYPELLKENKTIREEYKKEREQSFKTIEFGTKEEEKFIKETGKTVFKEKAINLNFLKRGDSDTAGAFAFEAYQDFGLPLDATLDNLAHANIVISDIHSTARAFNKKMEEHLKVSAVGQEKKFGGHGLILDTGELKAANEEELKIVTRLHTVTHLLNAALRKVLGDSVVQNGSDITVERTRFDFNFPRKLTPEEIKRIEDVVNEAIQKDFSVTIETLPVEEAKKTGALYMERSKYPDPVKVYTVGNETEVFSKELCGGPHVTRTGEIGHFRITKEESSSSGIRRIRATVAP